MCDKQKNRAASSLIGQRLRMVRTNLGLTLAQLAEVSGIRPEQIDAFEVDDDLITAVELISLAKALKMPVEFFVHEGPLLDCSGEWQLLHAFRRLSPGQQIYIVQLIADLAADCPVTSRL
jgi:transcriptional regulator with XRE-family HTH domain